MTILNIIFSPGKALKKKKSKATSTLSSVKATYFLWHGIAGSRTISHLLKKYLSNCSCKWLQFHDEQNQICNLVIFRGIGMSTYVVS